MSRAPSSSRAAPDLSQTLCLGGGLSAWHAASVVIGLRSFIVLALLGVVSCSGEPDDAPTSPSVAAAPQARLEPTCPPAPPSPVAVASAKAANALFAAQNLPASDAADIGASTLLSDGRVVWMFGDTLRTGQTPGVVANSMLVSGGHCASQLMPAKDGPVIPDVGPHTVYWPMSALSWADEDRDRLVVLCSRIRRGPRVTAWTSRSSGLPQRCSASRPSGVPHLQTVVEVTPDNPDLQQVNWGAASFHDGRWIYVYGTRFTGEAQVFGRELYVARVPLGVLGDSARRGDSGTGLAGSSKPSRAVRRAGGTGRGVADPVGRRAR